MVDNYYGDLADGLAELHRPVQSSFGFNSDNFCGSSPQANPATTDGYAFFVESRLLFQARRAADAGLLEANNLQRLEKLCSLLPGIQSLVAVTK